MEWPFPILTGFLKFVVLILCIVAGFLALGLLFATSYGIWYYCIKKKTEKIQPENNPDIEIRSETQIISGPPVKYNTRS